MDRMSRAERWYGHLLRLYPSTYRARFGDEMLQVFRDLYREQRRPATGFWVRLSADAIKGAASEHVALIRSGNMKLYLSQSADQRVLFWGAGLMAPAGLFFVAAALGLVRAARLTRLPVSLPILPVLIAVLPMVALAINVLALVKPASEHKEPVFSLRFARKYFWTLALIAVSGLWLVFLFGHDTIGCGLHYLQLLKWSEFQYCAATH